ncbi:ABC transporter ATP-binding protein [Alsobacter ponti]|uniref:ABC transporter ATP-binding protein n=1 Tax=Alsobacter ponti TaxID=2962936 RepID=UPI0020C89092
MAYDARPEGPLGGARDVAPPALRVAGVSKTFRPRDGRDPFTALSDVSLDVSDNTFVSILGPSGCGKTTLLRMMNGLLAPDNGEVLLGGKPPRPGPDVGFVFQSFRLLPWRTIRGNVELGLEETGLSRAERRERALRYLALVGLSRFAESYPHELSGGMKQRVALARALAPEPSVLLMDEPFASLDAQTRELMQMELLRLWERRRGVVVFVTHSVDEAIVLSDRIVLMRSHPGRIAEVLDVDLPRPRWDTDVHTRREFVELRHYLWEQIKAMVLASAEPGLFGSGDAPG